jgi:cell wall-associated NlpC family hydrolase
MAVAAGAVGGLLLYAGIQDVPIVDALREISAGRQPTPRPPKPASVEGFGSSNSTGQVFGPIVPGGGSGASAVVAAAAAQIGKPYVWGAEGPNAFDCSGLVVFCLNRVGVKVGRLTTWGFAVWSGARTIPKSQATTGDLVMYSGHMGIVSGPGTMIHAPRVGKPVEQRSIYTGNGGPWYRRVRAFEASASSTGRGAAQESKSR